MLAEATPAELEACRRLLPGLLDVFQIVPVPLFDDATAIEVLKRIAFAHATSAKLELEPGLIALVHRLFKRFRPYSVFPGAASVFLRALIERAGRRPRTQPEPRPDQRDTEKSGPTVDRSGSVGSSDVVDLFLKQTGLPEVFLRNDLPLSLESVQEHFDTRIIGQPEATNAVARLVTTVKAGLNDPARPFGVLLFCGPTGVGKTAMAVELADFCFGTSDRKDRLVRLDMTEYSSWGAAQRLLLDPQGRPAPWIERVRQQPFCVVLFDEIEKAAPEVFDVLLGLLDEGRLTDRFGRVTWFRSTFLLLTSNLGASATEPAGFSSASTSPHETEVARFFRPEFFNRLDGVVTFAPLGPEQVLKIARKELWELEAREGLASAQVKLGWSEMLVARVAREGYDHRFGARPLQRAIERLIVTPLARWKVANPTARNLTLHVDLDPTGEVTVTRSV
jgi:ATP-dependent Clp protease ATP-binding subunit ClpC